MKYILGIDIGTSGCKCIIIDQNGDVAASEISGLDIISEKQGYSEQNPEEWWFALKSGIYNLKKKHDKILKNS